MSCRSEINPLVQSDRADDALFRPPNHRGRRSGNFVVRHARPLMALAVIAVVGAGVALAGSSDNAPKADDAAPQALIAGEQAAQASDSSEAQPTATAESTPTPRTVRARGRDGKVFSCGPQVMDRVQGVKDRVARRERILKARRAAVRHIEHEYPSGRAPGSVVDRYNTLVARSNAQVDWTNRAINAYNKVLEQNCSPES